MSYQEKRSLLTIISGVLLVVVYCIHAFGKYQSGATGPYDLEASASIMLVFIGIGIATIILIQIIFHILLSFTIALKNKNRNKMTIGKIAKTHFIEDEMNKIIELKASRAGMVTFSVGFVTALFSLVFGATPVLMLNILFLSFIFSGLVNGLAGFYHYRNGVR